MYWLLSLWIKKKQLVLTWMHCFLWNNWTKIFQIVLVKILCSTWSINWSFLYDKSLSLKASKVHFHNEIVTISSVDRQKWATGYLVLFQNIVQGKQPYSKGFSWYLKCLNLHLHLDWIVPIGQPLLKSKSSPKSVDTCRFGLVKCHNDPLWVAVVDHKWLYLDCQSGNSFFQVLCILVYSWESCL